MEKGEIVNNNRCAAVLVCENVKIRLRLNPNYDNFTPY